MAADNRGVDQIPRRIAARTDTEWNEAWTFAPHVPKLVRQLGPRLRLTHREALMQAAYFCAGKLHDEDFHMFANGGQPLLRRQRGEWSDEVLFHAPPGNTPGHYSPVAVEILVGLEPLKEIRAKYSRSYTMVPAFVAKANLGELLPDPCRMIWNVEFEDAIVDIANCLQERALAWIEDLCDPLALEERVIEGALPFVDDATGLELVLALGGKLAARRVVNEWRDDPLRSPSLEKSVARLSRQFGPVYRSEDSSMNVAVLCICFDLWSKNRFIAPR